MSVTRNHRVTNESKIGSQAAVSFSRNPSLINEPCTIPAGCLVKCDSAGGSGEQPLDFSVKSSPSPSLTGINSPSVVRSCAAVNQQPSHSVYSAVGRTPVAQKEYEVNVGLPGVSLSNKSGAIRYGTNADRAVESLLILGHSTVAAQSSRSSSSSSVNNFINEPQLPRSRRKPTSVTSNRRALPSASPSTGAKTDGLLVVSQGDTASSDWQFSSPQILPSSSPAAHDERQLTTCASATANTVTNNNLSISSDSMSSASFSPSSNGGSSAFNLNLKLKLITDESGVNSRRYRHRQSSSSQHQAISIPPDSTTASVDGEEDGRIKVRTANGVVNRRRPRAFPDEKKDESYWERRRKNNEAAKRSRDARRQKEDDVAYHANKLEEENKRLREEVAELRAVVEQLRAEVLAKQQQEQQSSGNGQQLPLVGVTDRARENSENCDPVIEPAEQAAHERRRSQDTSLTSDSAGAPSSVINNEITDDSHHNSDNSDNDTSSSST